MACVWIRDSVPLGIHLFHGMAACTNTHPLSLVCRRLKCVRTREHKFVMLILMEIYYGLQIILSTCGKLFDCIFYVVCIILPLRYMSSNIRSSFETIYHFNNILRLKIEKSFPISLIFQAVFIKANSSIISYF